MSRRFHLGVVLTAAIDKYFAPTFGEFHEFLDYMTGDTLFTHQLSRACRECQPEILRQHPQLAELVGIPDFPDEPSATAWLNEQVARFGEGLEVTPLERDQHTHIDPLQELAMNHPHIAVVPVVIGDGEAQ